MNIKSDFLKEKIPLFKDISYQRFLGLAVFTAVLASIIIASGTSFWWKLIITLIAIAIILLSGDDLKSDDKDEHYRIWFGSVFLVWVMLEIPLGIYSFQTTEQKIYTQREDSPADVNLSAPKEVTVLFYDSDTLEQIGSRKTDSKNTNQLKFWESVTGEKTYIEYFPFMKYKEKSIYIHTKL